MTLSPAKRSKSLTFRVTTLIACTWAAAAMRASRKGAGSGCSPTWTQSDEGQNEHGGLRDRTFAQPRAGDRRDEFQRLLIGYCFERFLSRLGTSTLRDRFVLKGAILLRVWSEHPYRATRDLDLLRLGEASTEAILEDVRSIVTTPVEPDAVEFGAAAIRIESIRAEDEYVGIRAKLPARCGHGAADAPVRHGARRRGLAARRRLHVPDASRSSRSIVRRIRAPGSDDAHGCPVLRHCSFLDRPLDSVRRHRT